MWLQRRMHERRNSRNLAGHGTVVEDTSACLKSKPSVEMSSQLVFCVFQQILCQQEYEHHQRVSFLCMIKITSLRQISLWIFRSFCGSDSLKAFDFQFKAQIGNKSVF